MIAAVAFVPPNDVTDVFEELSEVIRNSCNADADGILDYIEDSYIGQYRRNAPRRRPPLFAIEMWNMFHRTHLEITTLKAGAVDLNHCVQHGILPLGSLLIS